MNENNQVYIEKEGRVFRWGQAAYFQTWNGLKKTVSIESLRVAAIPIAVVLAALTYFFSKEKDLRERQGSELQAPTLVQADQILNAPIYTGNPMAGRQVLQSARKITPGQIRIYSLRSYSEIPVGSEARGILESGATDGIVKAKLISALTVDGESVLPEGTTLFGRGKSSEERLFVEFNKVIFPNGESLPIIGQAFDASDKILGIKGSIVGRRTKKMGMAIGFGVIGGMADALQETSGSSFFGNQKRSVRDAAFAGASKAALDQSQVYIDEMKNSPNVIEVKRGTEFFLIIDEQKGKED